MQRTAPLTRSFAALAVLAMTMAGCAPLDPMYRAGEWHPSHANDADLRAMVANPADLVAGVSQPAGGSIQAAAAVARLRQGNVKSLPDSGLAEVRLQAAGETPSVAAPNAGGS